ncbi:probable E3 ubiquitin-protein ligase ZFP1 [Agrilus planipennis]|uniref:Probable E3 ubiquitin-protein ligase ZFP1 n=1 Tax=Agrilus planipennis TaxID=224129 RepID=A0A1W4XDK0_AGRPL|nr:probable E3 ubiquitin-protein ligase ZFP1 [Agrilus planipennis]XP_018330508.1 probable E3 ubiquitin-protein ligase ZFP1 [Agrilus planipennis]
MDSTLSKFTATRTTPVSENAKKRKYTTTADSVTDNVDNWHSSSKKFSQQPLSTCSINNVKENNENIVHGFNSGLSESNIKQCIEMINSTQKSSQPSNQSLCQSENDKQVANHTVNSVEPNSNHMIEQNINYNRNRIQTYFSNGEIGSADTPIWLSNINNSQRMLLNWHPFHHRLYLRQQLEMERRRVSLLKNSSRNPLGFNHMFVGQIGRGIIPSQTDEKKLKLELFITANTRILSSKETVNLVEATCVICFMKFKEQQLIRELSCLHRFHKNCIDKWLVNQMNCPICRLPLGENFTTTLNADCSVNHQSLLNSQSPFVPVSNGYYLSKEINNTLSASNGSATTEPAEIRDFKNNLAIPWEDNINIANDSKPDTSNVCTQNLLHCNQSEDTNQSQETTDDTSKSTVQVIC